MEAHGDSVSGVPVLTTQRLLLRPFVEEDAPAVFSYSRNPLLGHDAGWPPHRSIEDSLSFITHIASQDHVWALVELTSEAVIGSIGLVSDDARSYEGARALGYALSEQWWGNGLMTEAAFRVIRFGFEELGLTLISCTHYVWNNRSKRVIEKCGFKFEGIRRQAEKTPSGTVEDFACYSLLSVEFKDTRS